MRELPKDRPLTANLFRILFSSFLTSLSYAFLYRLSCITVEMVVEKLFRRLQKACLVL